jgi:diguanylate cyclase (GGDEF)-like protein
VDPTVQGDRSLVRLFTTHAVISLVPVLILGAVLGMSYRTEARRRGVGAGRSEAQLIAETSIEPLLEDRLLRPGELTAAESRDLQAIVKRGALTGSILRLRLRDLTGHMVFSDDGTGFSDAIGDEPLTAAAGGSVAILTHLNADTNDTGPRGPETVEVYLPLVGAPGHRIGVLEIYLPYDPIADDVSAGLHSLEVDLAVGLGALYLALLAISVSVSRGLRRESARNAWLAEHDTLTGLPNRVLFRRRAESAVRVGPTTLAVIDLDRFKEVNDSLGHQSGDLVLVEIAERLSAQLAPGATLARLGADEFGIVLPGVVDAGDQLWRARARIVDEVAAGELRLSIEASVGYVVSGEDADDVAELLQRADLAMDLAKANHAGVVRYDPDRDHYDASNLGLISELRRAIDAGQLVVHYQPKLTIADGRVEAVEALVRWVHPQLGLIGPDRFVPLAERTDVIDDLTRWVLRTSLAEVADLGLPVAVNVSARNLVRPEFAGQVEKILRDQAVHPSRLLVEMTETAVLSDPVRAAATLQTLAAAGVRSSLDDFGQGQTSLGYLPKLALYELKIDKEFVSDLTHNPAHAAIVGSMISLGHHLGLRITAEGVETDEVLAALSVLDCDVAQGFLIARPMPIEALRTWLRGHRPAPALQT